MKSSLFSKVKNVDDIKNILSCMDNYKRGMYNPDIIEEGFNSLNNLDELRKNNLVVFSKSVDGYFGFGNDSIIIRNKLSTILATAILLDKCYDETMLLNEKEFLTLAFYLSYENPILFKEFTLLYNKEILNLLCARFSNYADREYIMEALADKIDSGEVMKDNIFEFISSIDVLEARKIHESEIEKIGKVIL